LHITGNGKTAYYHSMAAAVIARPGGNAALPPAPELIRNEWGRGKTGGGSCEEEKQGCERKAVKRLLEKHGKYHRKLKATPLGDELYAGLNTLKLVADAAWNTIELSGNLKFPRAESKLMLDCQAGPWLGRLPLKTSGLQGFSLKDGKTRPIYKT
jgi:hypothetical protein